MRKELFMLFLMPLTLGAKDIHTASPDGRLTVHVQDEGAQARYAVTYDGEYVISPSLLGFKADFGDFTRGLHITETKTGSADQHYQMRQAKQSHIHYTANTLTVSFENERRQQMAVEFSVGNNDIAFRYLIPQQEKDRPKCAVITQEETSFLLPDGTTTFLCPQIGPMTGWERTKPSYEEEYAADAPMTSPSRFGQGYTFPCLFKTTGNETTHWVLISETGVSSLYCASHLSDYQPDKGYTIAFPQQGENNGVGSTCASIAVPGATPWRTITIGNTLKPIVETTIAYDVVRPLYEPSCDYQGGRYTWSWLIWQDNSINYDDQVRFIDLAAEMGYELCLVDNWWDQNIGRARMAGLSDYARKKGVSLLLWYNSNGHWNDAPQTPRDCMSTAAARDREMAWLKSIGVKGIKVDFFAGDKQETMKLYEDILFDANRYGLQVIFHGCTLPRGWERMYPNYVASEAVLASENVYFSEHHARQEPFELTMHPFCRNAVAAMDWGGVIMNKFLSKDNRSRHRRYTTDVFEMATGITNQSAVNCVAMQPNNLEELPQWELEWLRRLPTTWDETRFIDGYPGRYVVLARRHGTDWYVAGLNALQEPLRLTLDLPMLAGETVRLLTDNKKGLSLPATLKVDKKGKAKVELQPAGGLIIQR